jgi:TPP-dependent pyruvate/acetoin dehydrogenase alpha subunit
MDKKRLRLHTELYKKAYLIRRAEQGIIDHYASDAMKTPMHMSMGEEAITSGVCQALKKTDYVLGTYRSHALYLAKTGDPKKFFAEMYGKVTGIADGKAGSMHLSAPEAGYLLGSAIVAASIPVSLGVAYANVARKTGSMTAVFFGDGAIEEGVFWESLNFASLKGLPILFICEDNGLAVHSDLRSRHGYSSIKNIVSRFNCLVFESASTDAEVIYKITMAAIHKVKTLRRPAFLHLKYYRYLGHIGTQEDFNVGYRSRNEFYAWRKVDPVALLRKKLTADGLGEKRITAMERKIETGVERAIREAERAPFPKKNKLYENVFYEKKR